MVNSFVFLIRYLFFLSEMAKILHKKILNTLNLYWYHNDASEKINSLNGHSRETLPKWIEVCHFSCQVKFPWYNYVDELYYTRGTCDTIYLPIFKDAQAVQVFKKHVFVNNKLCWELRNKLFRKRQSYLMTVRLNLTWALLGTTLFFFLIFFFLIQATGIYSCFNQGQFT